MMRPDSFATLPADLKLGNRMQILEFFQAGGERTVAEAAERVGVSRQTATKAIRFFIGKGLLVRAGKADSTSIGGKRAELFSLSPDRCLLCAALWPDRLRLSLVDLRFRLVEQFDEPQALPDSVEQALRRLGALSDELLARAGVAPDRLLGVCVSTSGIVDYRTGSLKYSSLAPGWGFNIPVAGLLAPYFPEGTPILAENVSKVVARSLLHEKEIRDRRVLAVFSAWGGVCASFIEHDRILNGRDSLIGEIGHMTLAPDDDERCGCGGYGCFERLVSDARIRRAAAEILARRPDSALGRAPLASLTVKDVFAASAGGDEGAREIDAGLARYFAMALRNVSLSFNPELVVFHGDYAWADDYFRARLYDNLRAFRYYPADEPFELRLDRRPIRELDLRGAYTLLLDRLFSDPALCE